MSGVREVGDRFRARNGTWVEIVDIDGDGVPRIEPVKDQPSDRQQEEQFDSIVAACKALMVAKNHDYGSSWKEMRLTSITDQILVKVRRIKRLEDLQIEGKLPQVSEGIESEYRDILNYCVFALIKIQGG